jgi:hypothetical protein
MLLHIFSERARLIESRSTVHTVAALARAIGASCATTDSRTSLGGIGHQTNLGFELLQHLSSLLAAVLQLFAAVLHLSPKHDHLPLQLSHLLGFCGLLIAQQLTQVVGFADRRPERVEGLVRGQRCCHPRRILCIGEEVSCTTDSAIRIKRP